MKARHALAAAASAPLIAAGCSSPAPDAQLSSSPLQQPEPEFKQTAEDLTTTTEAQQETTTTLAVVLPTSPPVTIPIPETSIARGPLPVDASLTPYNGWAIPEPIVWCESRFNWDAYNPVSGAAGPYQLLAFHLGGDARLFSREAQHRKAAELWNGGRGASHWQECL